MIVMEIVWENFLNLIQENGKGKRYVRRCIFRAGSGFCMSDGRHVELIEYFPHRIGILSGKVLEVR